MRIADFIVAVFLGGLLLLGLLWLWFSIDDWPSRGRYNYEHRSGYYQSPGGYEQSEYLYQSRRGYNGGYRDGDIYDTDRPGYAPLYRVRRHGRRPCYDPCY